jgi:hypothetical protein
VADSHGVGAEQGAAGTTSASGVGQLPSAPAAAPPRSVALGLAAVVAASSSSAFASVYFERNLKGGNAHGVLWKRSMELCTWTVPMYLLLAGLQASADQPLSDPLRGFTVSTWAVIVVNGAQGGVGRACTWWERASLPSLLIPSPPLIKRRGDR